MGNCFGRKAIIGGLVVLLNVSGCPPCSTLPLDNAPQDTTLADNNDGNSDNAGGNNSGETDVFGTGVEGYNTPDEILANEDVARTIEQVRGIGHELNLCQEFSAPNIEGIYNRRATSYQIIPNKGAPIPSFLAVRISGQTLDNYVNVSYLQKDPLDLDAPVPDRQTLGRQIIRGENGKFTIYYVMNVYAGNYCEAERVSIIDGRIDDNGDILAIEIDAPVQTDTPECVFPRFANFLDLERMGQLR